MTTGTFTYEWTNTTTDESLGSATAKISGPPRSGHPQITALETEIFVPSLITQNRKVIVEGLDSTDSYRHDESRQTLFIVSRDVNPNKAHKVTVSLSPPLDPQFELNHFWGDFGGRIMFMAILWIGIFAAIFILH